MISASRLFVLLPFSLSSSLPSSLFTLLRKRYYYSLMVDRFEMYIRRVIHLNFNPYCHSRPRPLLSTFPLSLLITVAILFFFSFVKQCTIVRSHSLLRIIIITFYMHTIEKDVCFLLTLVCVLDVIILIFFFSYFPIT